MVVNNAPAKMVLQNIKPGYAMVYVGHSIYSDYDVLGRSFWLTQGTTTTRSDFTGLNTFFALLVGLKEQTQYSLQGAYFDQIIDAELLNAKISINMSNQTSFKTLAKPSITGAQSVSEQVDVGVGAPLLVVNTNGEADYCTLEAKLLPSGEWEKIYVGPLTPTISVGIPIGKYRLRLSGQVSMPDGVTVETSGTKEYAQDVEIKYVFTPPTAPKNLVFKAARIADGKERYDLRVEWSWDKEDGANAREFVVWYVDQESFAKNGWSKAQKINAGAAKAVTITSFPWNRLTRFRVQSVAWGPDMQSTTSSQESTFTLNSSTPLDDSFVNQTGIEVNYSHIKAYLKDGNTWTQTFLVDAATGAVSIGLLDENGLAPFSFDPINKILNVDGKVITKSINAASFILTNLNGKDNPALYSQGKTYGSNTSGLWMGMDNSTGKFKMDMGNATKYIRWDGDNLWITGGVTIGTPNGNMSLEEGITGNFQSYAYIKSATLPAKPTNTAYPPPNWSTLPPNRLPGEVIWAIVGRINPFTNALVEGTGWSDPARWTGDTGDKGEDGASGTSVQVQWAVAEGGPWHSTYQSGDLFMRQQVNGVWGTPIRAIGEDGKNGSPGATGEKGDYINMVFRANATQPAAPSGTASVPTGWSDAPPTTGALPVWMSKATISGKTGLVVGSWTTPIRLDGEDALPLEVQWSTTTAGPWHSGYQSGDIYMRQNVNGVWSTAIRAIGEDGGDGTNADYINMKFATNSIKPARPTGNTPSGWTDAPPAGTPLWMVKGTFSGATNTLIGTWSDPVRIDGSSVNPNLFEYRRWMDSISSVSSSGSITKDYDNLSVTVKSGASSSDSYTIPSNGDKAAYYSVEPSTVYTLSYRTDVATNSRVLVFFFNSTDNSSYLSFVNSTSTSTGLSTLTFTTPANCSRITVRLSSNVAATAVTFSEMKIEQGAFNTAYLPAPIDTIGKDGTDGTDGADGKDGAPAKGFSIISDGQSFAYDGQGVLKSSNAITIIPNKQNTTAGITWTATNQTGAAVTLTASGENRILTASSFGNSTVVTIRAVCDGLVDTITVVRLIDGSNNLVGYLSNEAAIVSANSSGSVLSYAAASGNFRVFYGTTEITSQCTFSASGSGITASINGSGGYGVSGMPSGTNALVATVNFTASHSVYGSITKLMSITKSVAGQGYNIVMTPQFEAGSRGTWGGTSAVVNLADLSIGDLSSIGRTKVLRVSARDTPEDNNWVDVTPGQKLKVSFWVNTKESNVSSGLGLWYQTAAGGNSWGMSSAVAAGQDWTLKEATYTVPANCVRVRPWIQMNGSSNFGYAYYANLSVVNLDMKGTDGADGANGTNGKDGANGKDAEPLKVQWSSNGTSWHDNYQANDFYMRQYVNGAWSAAIKAVGESGTDGADGINGNYTNLKFMVNPTQPSTPVGNTPTGWTDGPPGGSPLWMVKGTFNGQTNNIVGTWSTPVRVDGNGVNSNIWEIKKWMSGLTSINGGGSMTRNYDDLSLTITSSATGTDAYTNPFFGTAATYFEVAENTTYTVSFNTNSAAKAMLYVFFFTGTSTSYSLARSVTSTSVGTTSYTFTTPAGCNRVTFRASVNVAATTIVLNQFKLELGAFATAFVPALSDSVGKDADALLVQWSSNGSSWHDNYQANDLYMRQYVNGVWSAAIRVVGENGSNGQPGTTGAKGDYVAYIFRAATTVPATPSGATPSGWTDAPPATGIVWMSKATKSGATNALVSTWSTPIRLTGEEGADGADGKDGANGTNGKDGANGSDGSRGAGIFTQALVEIGSAFNPSTANTFFQQNFGSGPVKYDVLTQYKSSDPKISYTSQWNGTAWVAPGLTVHGNMIVTGTITSDKIVADNAFLSRVGVNVIYNRDAALSSNPEANYRMKIDLVNGYIHIR